jgi:hypothetical protein
MAGELVVDPLHEQVVVEPRGEHLGHAEHRRDRPIGVNGGVLDVFE